MTVTQRYLMYISYIGTGFRGSQIQICGQSEIQNSVQGTIEKALQRFFKLPDIRPITVGLSSRTDSGVHAIKTGVHVDLPPFRGKFVDPIVVRASLNGYFFKQDLNLRILKVLEVPDIFNARYSALEKVYLYRVGIKKQNLTDSNLIPPICETNRTYFSGLYNFDLEKAKEIIPLFLGKKDFATFMGRPSQSENRGTICNLKSFTIEKARPFLPDYDLTAEQYDYYNFVVRADRFLYRMVRRMVAVVLAFGGNRITLEEVRLMFDKPEPSSWSSKVSVVPGCGLYLANVIFNPEHLVMTEEEKEEKSKLLNSYREESKKRELDGCEIEEPIKEPFAGFRKFFSSC